MSGVAEILVGWPIVASIALAVTARGWRAGRRRGALNEALHELRRPLQSLVLAADAAGASNIVGGSAELASQALERLDREINGGGSPARREVVRVRPLLAAAVGRWKSRASLAGGSLELCRQADEALVAADSFDLAQALDNLIVNAIEHGGPIVVVRASRERGLLWVSVSDSGRASRPAGRRETPAELVARLSGRRRRGHGLSIVRRVAARCGGHFSLRRSENGSDATLVLPLADGRIESSG
ncbi:MAG TPA: HAMP domain-containing sensor histidine kinase [Solirubrobacterales bacterium]|nr:HAMP domain-containing sensor histidine kinase [Solirubrobacterales bacterium]